MSAIIDGIIEGLSGLARAKTKPLVPLLSVIALAGCAIHPVQQDVTGVPTPLIVDRIRCETRLAIQDKAIDLLLHYGDGNDQAAIELSKKLGLIRGKPWRINPYRDLADQVQRNFYFRYIQTGIAYDFTFDVTEDNKVALLADPVRFITNGTAGIGINGSSELNRNNSRHFIVSDTFENLLGNERLVCDSDVRVANFVYPISGRVGMYELISTFVDLNEDKNLQPLDSGNSRVFADTLTFITTLTGSVAPHVEISPVGNRFGLASPTNFTASGQRLDKHSMIVGLSMAPPKSVLRQAGVASAVPILGLSGARSALQKSYVGSAEQGALDAVRQQRIDTFLDRFGTLPLR